MYYVLRCGPALQTAFALYSRTHEMLFLFSRCKHASVDGVRDASKVTVRTTSRRSTGAARRLIKATTRRLAYPSRRHRRGRLSPTRLSTLTGTQRPLESGAAGTHATSLRSGEQRGEEAAKRDRRKAASDVTKGHLSRDPPAPPAYNVIQACKSCLPKIYSTKTSKLPR